MKHIGIAKPDTLVSILNWAGVPLIAVYIICMLIYPCFKGGGDWGYVHNVWHNWQSLNVGMLAFISSIIAFNISKFNANKQRERNFIAAKAFLPEALSELTAFFNSSATLLKEAWKRVKDESDNCTSPLHSQIPNLLVGYKETFSRCIASAEPDVGEHLSYLLMRLQIHNSRLIGLAKSFSEDNDIVIVPYNIISHFYHLAELQALTNRLFGFARGLEQFDNSDLILKDFQNAYGNFEIWSDNIEGLMDFTQKAIERNSSDETT